MSIPCPATVYYGTLVYIRTSRNGDYFVRGGFEVVSGRYPLTDAEVVARLRKRFEDNWPAEYSPRADWVEDCHIVGKVYAGPPDH